MNSVILIDNSGSMEEILPIIERVLKRHIKETALSEIITCYTFTDSLKKILPPYHLEIDQSGHTAIFKAAAEAGRKIIGRGEIVILSDGEDTTDLAEQEEHLEIIKSNKIPVFTIGIEGKAGINPTTLKRIASTSGGRYYKAERLTKVDDILSSHMEKTAQKYYKATKSYRSQKTSQSVPSIFSTPSIEEEEYETRLQTPSQPFPSIDFKEFLLPIITFPFLVIKKILHALLIIITIIISPIYFVGISVKKIVVIVVKKIKQEEGYKKCIIKLKRDLGKIREEKKAFEKILKVFIKKIAKKEFLGGMVLRFQSPPTVVAKIGRMGKDSNFFLEEKADWFRLFSENKRYSVYSRSEWLQETMKIDMGIEGKKKEEKFFIKGLFEGPALEDVFICPLKKKKISLSENRQKKFDDFLEDFGKIVINQIIKRQASSEISCFLSDQDLAKIPLWVLREEEAFLNLKENIDKNQGRFVVIKNKEISGYANEIEEILEKFQYPFIIKEAEIEEIEEIPEPVIIDEKEIGKITFPEETEIIKISPPQRVVEMIEIPPSMLSSFREEKEV